MRTDNSSTTPHQNYFSGLKKEKGNPISKLNRPVVLGLLAFLIFLFFFSLLIFQRYQLVKEAEIKAAEEIAHKAKDRIQEAITHSLAATKTLSFFIDPQGNVKDFDSISKLILESGTEIDAIQLVPDGVIKYVYPLRGNEKVIGYNILTDTARNKEAFKAIKKKQLFFAGPFPLKQGGIGVVGRLPVYRNNKFWGFSAVVIKMSTLFKTAGIDSSGTDGYYFQLSKINPSTSQEEYFLPMQKSQIKGMSVSVKVPDGEWKLSVISTKNHRSLEDVIILAILGLLLSILGSMYVYRILVRPQKLKELVQLKTRELDESEKNYRSLIERVSDACISLDKDWNFTFVNSSAGEIFASEPGALLGKNIWAVFPEAVDQPFYHAYQKAMEIQANQYFEEYYPRHEKWFENHIYPSKDGLTIFFKDVTEIKQVSLALKNNEEKYRSLIEQASDGIVLTDLEGIILEVNNSIQQMIGYSDKEMIGHHLTEFLPEEDLNNIPLRIHELMQGKSLLYERKLLKKDGSTLPVEVNSKMASMQTLIGFVRDISLRKKAAEALRKSTERFELIAEVTNDVIWDHDFVHDKTWGNKNLYKLYGIEQGAAVNFEMFLSHIHPDEREEIKNRLTQAIENGSTSISEEFRFMTANGEYRNFYDRAYIKYDTAGNPDRIMGAMMDITEKEKVAQLIKDSEEKYRLIVEQASDGIFIADNQTYFIDVNTAGCQMLGYTLDEIKKIKIIDLIPEEDLVTNPPQITKLKHGDSVINERRLKRKDGTLIDVEISAKLLSDGRFQSIARDITERKRAEDKLVEKEKKLQQVLASTADNFYVIDTEYKVIIINKVAERNLALAWAKPVAPGTNLLDVIPEKGEEPIRENFERAFAGEGVEYEMHLDHPDLPTWVLIQFTPVTDESGRITGVAVVAKDISERKKTVELIRESEERYRALVENAPEALVVFDVKKQMFVNVSESATRLFGMSKEELLRTGPVDISPEYQPDGWLSAEAAQAYIQKAIKGEKPSFEWTHCNKAGGLIPCEVWLVRLPAENEVLIRVSIIDITERNKAKELLQKSYDEIRQLASNLQSIREDERTNIAREIHDELGQQLTGLKMDMHWLTRKLKDSDTEINKKMQDCIELVNSTITTVRKIATDLRPSILDDLGLLAALEWQSEEFEKRSGTKVLFNNQAGDISVAPLAATALFRIYQELLTNIARHANATRVNATITSDENSLYFSIKDNGTGFNLNTINRKKTLGLLGIKERTLLIGGNYEIKTNPGEGAEIIISIPLTFIENEV